MQFAIAKSKIERTGARLNLAVLICASLLFSNILLVLLCWYSLAHKTKIIVPANFRTPFVISNNYVDSSYLQQMGLFFIATRLNITPGNILGLHKLLLEYTDSSFYHSFKQVLAMEQDQVLKNKISAVFLVNSTEINPQKLSIIINGKLKRWVGHRKISESLKNYVIKFTYNNSRLSIKSFSELNKDYKK